MGQQTPAYICKEPMIETHPPPKPPPPQKPLRPWKCCRCGAILLFVYLTPGTVLEIVCPQCREQQSRTAAE